MATVAPELVRCAGCGVAGAWVGGQVVNAEAHPVAPLCPAAAPRKRGHGPWLPDVARG